MSGYVDLQVNGYGGVDFNSDDLTSDQAVAVCRRLTADGTAQILATVITASMQKMVARIRRLADLIEAIPEVSATITGIHVEGPFINRAPGFVGAHPAAHAIPAATDLAKNLVDAGRGYVRMLTLAPEIDAKASVTRWLSDNGIVVAAGHCDPSLDQLRQSIDNGTRLFTHLGNGCPGLLPRHDNIIQRVLSLSDQIMVSFIADGHHVPAMALGNYIHRVPDQNIVIVTDAISAAGLGPGRYVLSDQVVEVDADGAAWAEGREHFAGCATTFPSMIEFLKNKLSVNDHQIKQWFTDNPLRLIERA